MFLMCNTTKLLLCNVIMLELGFAYLGPGPVYFGPAPVYFWLGPLYFWPGAVSLELGFDGKLWFEPMIQLTMPGASYGPESQNNLGLAWAFRYTF